MLDQLRQIPVEKNHSQNSAKLRQYQLIVLNKANISSCLQYSYFDRQSFEFINPLFLFFTLFLILHHLSVCFLCAKTPNILSPHLFINPLKRNLSSKRYHLVTSCPNQLTSCLVVGRSCFGCVWNRVGSVSLVRQHQVFAGQLLGEDCVLT